MKTPKRQAVNTVVWLHFQGAWSEDVADAWEQLFLVIIDSMRTAMEEELQAR